MTTVEQDRQTLGDRYELQELIATGGMGQVWRGRDLLLERSVAVKVLRSEYADDPTFLARFRNEARHAAALSHPNIATVLDYGEDSDDGTGEHLAYLVMELVEGAPLSTRIRDEGALEPQAALSVLRQAAAGLAEAHRAGVVHRDVKPSNILVRPDGRVKLTDFGIAWSAECVPLTQTGQVIGTAQYMSPEQAAGERVSPASDVYALGLVGYESLTGHAAFSGTNPVTVALKQVREQPEPLPDDLPPDVRELIGSALTKDPGARLPDGAAFLHAVEDTLDHRSEPVPSTAPVAVAAGVPEGPPEETPPDTVAVGAAGRTARRAPAQSPPRQGNRRRLLVLLPLLALLLVVGGIAFVSTRSGEAPAAEAAETTPGGIVLTAADHVGRPVTEVVDALTALGLTVGQRSEATADVAPGTVVRLSPVDAELAPGDRVEVVVAVPVDTAVSAPEPSAPDAGAEGDAAPLPAPATTEDAAPDTADTGGTAPADTGTPTTGATAPGTTPGVGTAPGSTGPGSTAPGDTAPGDATPGDTAPDSAGPGSAAPGDTTPGSTGPGDAGTGSTAPEDTGGSTPPSTEPSTGAPEDTAAPPTTPPATETGTGTPEDDTTPTTGGTTEEPATPSSDAGTTSDTGSSPQPATPDADGSATASVPAGEPAPAGASG